MITVCFIENVDAMGVHTGDSYCVAPMLTVPKELQQRLQDISYRIVESIGVIGGTNVQFAHDPEDRPDRRDRDQPAHIAVLGAGIQGDRFPDRADLFQARGRYDAGRDSLLARRHAGEVHAVRRLRRREVLPLGVREVPRLHRQARHADAGGRRGHEHRQELQGGLPEVDPLARDQALRPGLREELQPAAARGAAQAARRAVLGAAVHHVRGAAQGHDASRSCTS